MYFTKIRYPLSLVSVKLEKDTKFFISLGNLNRFWFTHYDY